MKKWLFEVARLTLKMTAAGIGVLIGRWLWHKFTGS
jgi:hypothetical protein